MELPCGQYRAKPNYIGRCNDYPFVEYVYYLYVNGSV
nr:MAG TPA: hypothetical protein [Caudoviricetes sp.]